MKIHSVFFGLIAVFILGVFLRFYSLGGVPVGFHRDEAFFGYNAYALLKTGMDMNGNLLPLHLQSFLYSPAGYSYFSIPFILLFGLNEFSVRFTSALFGALTIPVVYFLALNLFSQSKFKEHIGICSALLLAISPWHINLSRVATENVLVVFFIAFGVLIYLKWIQNSKILVLAGAFLCFMTALFLYQAPRSFLPLLLPLLFVFFRPKLHIKKALALFILFGLSILTPIMLVISSPHLSHRLQMLSIFTNPDTKLTLEEQIREDGSYQGAPLITRFYHNKVINYSSTFLQNYFKHFSYDFLFADAGLPMRYKVPGMGLLYIFEIPLLLLGFFTLFNEHRRVGFFLAGWILLAPLGSGLTFDDIPNLQRTLLIFPALSLVSGMGAFVLWQKLGKVGYGKYGKTLMVAILVYSFSFYLHQYYVHQVHHRAWFRQEGYKELISEVDSLLAGYDKVVVTEGETDPSIFFLFYHAYDPVRVQSSLINHPTDRYGLLPFEKYTFASEECPLHEDTIIDKSTGVSHKVLNGKKNILYVNRFNCKFSVPGVKTLREIRRSDDTVVFKIQALQ